MWLINVETLTLHEYHGRTKPPYAILSHTWDEQEVSFADVLRNPQLLAEDNAESKQRSIMKIRSFCRKAREFGLYHGWVDTCCIDKSSSAELSEAINSMFRYYTEAVVCFAYLGDVHWRKDSQEEDLTQLERTAFQHSRWFTRGWTLQELIAPRALYFCDSDWQYNIERLNLSEEILAASGIPLTAMTGSLDRFSVASKMSWASKRTTTREEDTAYCLLGLFDVNMPLLYGEGERNAFQRLQIEIMRQTPDESLFAWEPFEKNASAWVNGEFSYFGTVRRGMLAEHPIEFSNSYNIEFAHWLWRKPFSMTHIGLQIELDLHSNTRYEDKLPHDITGPRKRRVMAAALRCRRPRGNLFVIFLEPNGHNSYARIGPLIESNKAQLGPLTECFIRPGGIT